MIGHECTEYEKFTDATDCTAISSAEEMLETGLCGSERTDGGRRVHRDQYEREARHPKLCVEGMYLHCTAISSVNVRSPCMPIIGYKYGCALGFRGFCTAILSADEPFTQS